MKIILSWKVWDSVDSETSLLGASYILQGKKKKKQLLENEASCQGHERWNPWESEESEDQDSMAIDNEMDEMSSTAQPFVKERQCIAL